MRESTDRLYERQVSGGQRRTSTRRATTDGLPLRITIFLNDIVPDLYGYNS
jgi:hypothetical protein